MEENLPERVQPHPVTGPEIRVSHLKKIQQKIVPAITDGSRRNSSDVPSLLQMFSSKISKGGWARLRLAR